MATERYEQLYRSIPLFNSLTSSEFEEIHAISRLFRARKGAVILDEGSAGSGMYVILNGLATCRLRLHQGDDTHLANLYRGDIFGEMSLIDDGTTSASVTAVSECILYRIERTEFNALRQAMRPAAYKVLRELAPIICERLRALNSRIGEMFSQPERYLRLMADRQDR